MLACVDRFLFSFLHFVKTWSHAAQRLGCVRIFRRVDQDSPWESATGRAVAPRAEACHSRQPGVEGPLAEWCAQHAEVSKQVAEPRGCFIVVGPRGLWRKGGARSGVDTCEGAIKTQASSVQQSRCGQRGSKVEGHQVGEGFGSYGGFFRSRGRLFAEGTRKGPRGSTGTPLGGSNQRMPRIYNQGRASRREVGGRRHGREEHVGGRASTIESVGATVASSSSQLSLQVEWPSWSNRSTPLVQERDAFRAAAIPTKKRGPVTPRPPQSSTEAHEVLMTRAAKRHAGRPVEEDVMPEDAQGLSEWLIDRQCDLRDAPWNSWICNQWAI